MRGRGMAKGYSYVVKRDYGFAPNPFHGFITLATCKPVIRKGAQVGDYVIGCADKRHGNRLVYMMKVSGIVTFDTYWTDTTYRCKKPVMNGSLVRMYGDNIYHRNGQGSWIQEDSHHSYADGSANPDNLRRDTKTTDRVLIGEEFFYLGQSMIPLPDDLNGCIYRHVGQKCIAEVEALALWHYLEKRYPEKGLIDDPRQFRDFTRYDGKS